MADEKNINPSSREATKDGGDLKELLKDKTYLQIPKAGDLVKGVILSITKNEVKIDLPGYRVGVVRGNELYNESEEFTALVPGDEIEATVVDLENENGEVELSFKFAGQRRTWTKLDDLRKSGEKIKVKVLEANKGGLMAKFMGVGGFIPVSQLSPEHYPRVQGGDKSKILERLRKIIGKEIDVKVLDASQQDEKLIFSEKQIWEEDQKENIARHKVGDIVEGEITAVTDFGVFLKFGDLEGLIHISELVWQRIDNPQELYKIGDKIRAAIVNIAGSRIFLSTKRLQEDPWKKVAEKFNVGDKVKGKVLKVNPFGLFVELDTDIHGLAHISEMGDKKPEDVKPGEEIEFTIINIEPNEHRLGLALGESKKQKNEKIEKQKNEKTEEIKTSSSAPSSPNASEGRSKATDDKETENKE